MYKEIIGDLIKLSLRGEFDVITHGCNCFCTMGAGIAPKMAETFGCDKFPLEAESQKGNINKLGQIDFKTVSIIPETWITIVNSYTQYGYDKSHSHGVTKPLDYEALSLCLRKMNYLFNGKRIGLPRIGCGLAGGNWNTIKEIIQKELKSCEVTVVIFGENRHQKIKINENY
jgi:O-acetyl-ADP-ribose deacetylase (regulator of RNase III)